uniref:Uncharacterized protein n=1 Tax=Rhizophora mucronata TaxID=61149 RepID=A0A2P2NZ15_RHIMU
MNDSWWKVLLAPIFSFLLHCQVLGFGSNFFDSRHFVSLFSGHA